jgi:hypothetical protein
LHVKVHLAATAVAVVVSPIQLAPASTAWRAAVAGVHVVMAAVVVAADLAVAAVVVAPVVAVAATVAATAVAVRSAAD